MICETVTDGHRDTLRDKMESALNRAYAQHRAGIKFNCPPSFLADRTNGRAYATVLRLSSVCDVMYCG